MTSNATLIDSYALSDVPRQMYIVNSDVSLFHLAVELVVPVLSAQKRPVMLDSPERATVLPAILAPVSPRTVTV